MPKKTTSTKPTPDETLSRGDATRQKLLTAAHKLFLQQGFHGTSMREIADEAGVAVSGIYNHFATKEDIFAAVLEAFHPYHVLVPALEEIETKPDETVEGFVRQATHTIHTKMLSAENRVLPLLFMELLEFQGKHLRSMAEVMLPKFLVILQRLGQLKGRLRPLPPPVILRTFMSLMMGFIMTEMLLRNTKLLKQFDLTTTQWLDGVADVYLHGILDEKPQ